MQARLSCTHGCSQAVKQHTGQALCSGISSILYYQKSEWSLTSHPGFTGSSTTDSTGILGCSARERLLLCEGATEEALYGILNSMLWWVLTINKAQWVLIWPWKWGFLNSSSVSQEVGISAACFAEGLMLQPAQCFKVALIDLGIISNCNGDK